MNMTGDRAELVLRPIGRVSRGRSPGVRDNRWRELESEIAVDPAWSAALDGLEDFSHIWVLWWLDRSDGPPATLRIHPERRPELPLVGLFATRSPHRPNPLGLTAVRLVGREGATLRVIGLDAFEGTPVFDIKPYLRRGDQVTEIRSPEWLERLWRTHDLESGGHQ